MYLFKWAGLRKHRPFPQSRLLSHVPFMCMLSYKIIFRIHLLTSQVLAWKNKDHRDEIWILLHVYLLYSNKEYLFESVFAFYWYILTSQLCCWSLSQIGATSIQVILNLFIKINLKVCVNIAEKRFAEKGLLQ